MVLKHGFPNNSEPSNASAVSWVTICENPMFCKHVLDSEDDEPSDAQKWAKLEKIRGERTLPSTNGKTN